MTPLQANMRAPYMHNTEPSRSATSSCGKTLTVLKEELSIECDYPYEGTISEVTGQKRYADITAVYHINAESSSSCTFTFILPQDSAVRAQINAADLSVTKTALHTDVENGQFSVFDRSLYSASFNGLLLKGENSITIKYRQRANVQETSYGYFTRSRFATSVSYELWPLKEWMLSDAFTLTVNVRVKDYSGIRRALFGSRNSIHIFEGAKKDGTMIENKASTVIQRKNHLTSETVYGRNFPDILTIIYGEN